MHQVADSTGYENICFETEQNVAVVTLNRPNRRNALSLELMLELLDCLDGIGKNSELRAVILAAAGKVFSSGHDLSEMVGKDINDYRRTFDVCCELMTKIQSIPQPVIAEVQGIATAAGCQLVATCDLAVASTEAGFATPGGKGGWFCSTPMVAVSRNIGRKRALEMLLTGDIIDAQTAADWGLINRAVPADQLVAESQRLLEAATRGSYISKGIGKQAYYAQMDLPQPLAYDYAIEVMASTSQIDDAQEGMHAFLEKRRANFKRP